jgi:hypothetical protein
VDFLVLSNVLPHEMQPSVVTQYSILHPQHPIDCNKCIHRNWQCCRPSNRVKNQQTVVKNQQKRKGGNQKSKVD